MRPPLIRSSIGILATLLLSSCFTSPPPLAPVGIEVQLYFLQYHSDVTATWTAEMDSTIYSPASFPDADQSANGSLNVATDVQPADLLKFAARPNLYPGRWDITIVIREGATVLATVNCRRVSVGDPDLAVGQIYVVRWTEDGSNTCNTAAFMDDPERPERDAEAVSMTSPVSAALGAPVPVSVSVRNNGDFTENVAVTLSVQATGGGPSAVIGNQVVVVTPSNTGQAIFTWNSACAGPAGSYTLSAVVAVPDDSNAANNTRTRSVTMTADREIQLSNFVGPTTVSKNRPGGTQFSVRVVNGSSQAESGIGINFTDTSTVDPVSTTINWLGSLPPWTLACGEATEHFFQFFPQTAGPGGAHTLTLSLAPVAAIPGDDPANNSVSLSITETP